jgi:DNA-binding transcriptional ArsR family regulator
MVKHLENLDTVFQALADPTRRGMLAALAEGEKTVTHLAEPFQMSLAAASKHIKKLEAAGLVEREVRGRVHHCRLSAEKLRAASLWLKKYERFWNGRLDMLESLLRTEDQQNNEGNLEKREWGHANDE